MFNSSRSRSMTFVGNGLPSTVTGPPSNRRRASIMGTAAYTKPTSTPALAEASARFEPTTANGPRTCPICDRVFTNASPSSALLFNKHVENCTTRHQTSLSIDAMTSRHRRATSASYANRSLNSSTSSTSSSHSHSSSFDLSNSSMSSSNRSSMSFDEEEYKHDPEHGLGNLSASTRAMFTVELEGVGSASEFGGFGKKEIPYELLDEEELQRPMKAPSARRLTLLGRAGRRRRMTGDVIGDAPTTPVTPTTPTIPVR